MSPQLGASHQPPVPTSTAMTNEYQDSNEGNHVDNPADAETLADGEYLDTFINIMMEEENRDMAQPRPTPLVSLDDHLGPVLRQRRNPSPSEQPTTEGAADQLKIAKRKGLK